MSQFLQASAQEQPSCGSFTLSFLPFPSVFGHHPVIGFRPVRGGVICRYGDVFTLGCLRDKGNSVLVLVESTWKGDSSLSLHTRLWIAGEATVGMLCRQMGLTVGHIWIQFCVLLWHYGRLPRGIHVGYMTEGIYGREMGDCLFG
jgi:hypothetical protein